MAGRDDDMRRDRAATIIQAAGYGRSFEERRWMDYPGGDIDRARDDNRDAVHGALARRLDKKPDDVTAEDVRRHAGLIADEDLKLKIYFT